MKDFPYLEYLKVRNFKSFNEIDLKLKQFNVIIGANASGKSNFVQIFSFLKDIREQGLDNAISLQGGIEYLCNFKSGQEQNLMMDLRIVLPDIHPLRVQLKKRKNFDLYYTGASWKFELRLGKRTGFKIIQDSWKIDVVAYERDDSKHANPLKGYWKITSREGTVHYDMHMQQEGILSDKDLRVPWLRDKITSKKAILEYISILDYVCPEIADFFDYVAVYDFDPKLAKRAAELTGKLELNNDGSNLAIIVKDVISNRDHRRKFSNLLTDLLPFVKSVSTENIADKSILFTLTENYFKKHSLPASFISDGTINITALIAALYFQSNRLTVIEEPERNIHPSLISKVMEMMNDVSTQRQIVITTHNPEIVRYAGLDHLFTVRRNPKGHSEIMPSSDQQEIRIFLENEMELEDLYVQNILGG